MAKMQSFLVQSHVAQGSERPYLLLLLLTAAYAIQKVIGRVMLKQTHYKGRTEQGNGYPTLLEYKECIYGIFHGQLANQALVPVIDEARP